MYYFQILSRFSFLGDLVNRGIAICHFSEIRETNTYSPGFGFGEFLGVFYFRFEFNLKFLFLEKNFFRNFFRNQKNNMIFMIRNDKIGGIDKISIKDNQIFLGSHIFL